MIYFMVILAISTIIFLAKYRKYKYMVKNGIEIAIEKEKGVSILNGYAIQKIIKVFQEDKENKLEEIEKIMKAYLLAAIEISELGEDEK